MVNMELTTKEKAIVEDIALRGLSNKEIGGKMDIAEKTVKNYLSRIFVKFGVRSRTEIAMEAFRRGAVPCQCPSARAARGENVVFE